MESGTPTLVNLDEEESVSKKNIEEEEEVEEEGVEIIEDSSVEEVDEEDQEDNDDDNEDNDDDNEDNDDDDDDNDDNEEEDDEEDDDDDDEDDDDEDDEDEDGDEEEDEEESSDVSKPIVPSLTIKRSQLTKSLERAATSSSPSASSPASPSLSLSSVGKTPKKRGRPSRAEMERREKEKQDKIARGEPIDPPPKRRGRKPMPPEQKERLRLERKRLKQLEKEQKKKDKMTAKQLKKAETIRRRKERAEGKKTPGKPGRKRVLLTEEEKEEREKMRKAKYEEFKRIKAEKAEKRKKRNEELKETRKKKKEEEKRQREAYEKRMQDLKASFLDESTQMSAACGETGIMEMDETSQSSMTKQSFANHEMSQLDPIRHVTAETLFEYRWPLEGRESEHYFLQEQVSEYLGVKSFKRRYPDVGRKKINHEERDFLVEMKVVNETQADLGLTAIPSSEVLDIMSHDFYEKYEEYMAVVAERKDRSLRQPAYSTAVTVERHQLADFVEKAITETANWNKRMNAEKKEKRLAYFDLQTFSIHYPQTGKGRMKVLAKPNLGFYPLSLIPGQFTDSYRNYSSSQLKRLPLNTVLNSVPTKPKAFHMAVATANLNEKRRKRLLMNQKRQAKKKIRRSDGSGSSSDSSSGSSSGSSGESDSDSSDYSTSCSPSSSGSSSDSDSEVDNVDSAPAKATVAHQPLKTDDKPLKPIDADVPGAQCKNCQGNRRQNKLGQPEVLLHCSKCDSSCHPTCVGLNNELLQFVTSYAWECTDCKNCSKCKDHTDEDKMLFCDLCDRGYHSYCVGLEEIPSGRWHCVECSKCSLCSETDPLGGGELTDELVASMRGKKIDWIFEFKPGNSGGKIYSHTMCVPCYRLWKKGQFCTECNICFGREQLSQRGIENFPLGTPVNYSYCWVCSRQHHSKCIGDAPRFICAACQRRTQEKCVGLAATRASVLSFDNSVSSGQCSPTQVTPSYANTSFTARSTSPQIAPNKRSYSVYESAGPVTCEVCSKVYKNRATLYSHKNRDHGLRGSIVNPKN